MPKINQEKYESEETEVKKDKQWLEKELRNLEKLVKEALEASLIAKNEHYTEKNSNELQLLRRVFSLVNQLDEPEVLSQELPVIPNYVAKWISVHHERFDLYPALKRLENSALSWEDVYKWYRKNTRKFVSAYLTGKYEVEEEQKYYAKVKGWGANGNDGHAYYSGKFPLSLTMSTESVAHTKDEWKNYGVYEDNADFVKVEELEE